MYLLTYGGLRRCGAAMACWDDMRHEGGSYPLTPRTRSGVPQDIKLQPVVAHHLNAYREALLHRGYPGTGRMLLGLSRRCYGRPRDSPAATQPPPQRHPPPRITAALRRAD